MIKNKVIATVFWGDRGGSKDDATISWHPINFSIYSDLFQEIVLMAVTEWIEDSDLQPEVQYELILEHSTHRDGGGAVYHESFQVMYESRDNNAPPPHPLVRRDRMTNDEFIETFQAEVFSQYLELGSKLKNCVADYKCTLEGLLSDYYSGDWAEALTC